uniref:Pre-mRNA-splicing factor 38 n=1 Tax=Compsopogon caeruleus TaxID=31354 RepID=A0A7S1T518_9RHOD|mmetsp:Transcript_10068/g.20369  ORF Transcript_10068/g.20369 Transcript_10068/m.20369 type:complete len:286 (+) Transcript_10068:190-1047(+)
MANVTDPLALNAHGTDPQLMVEKITREKIYQSRFWKEKCFGLSATSLLDRAVELSYVGGVHGSLRKPCAFLALVLKMLQLGPDRDIIYEYIHQDALKYVRVLGAFYLRLVGRGHEVYTHLEPLLIDYRKVRRRRRDAAVELTHVDELVDEMLTVEDMFDIKLPRLPSRTMLVETGQLGPRRTPLEGDIDEFENSWQSNTVEDEVELDDQQRSSPINKQPPLSLRLKGRRSKRSAAPAKYQDDEGESAPLSSTLNLPGNDATASVNDGSVEYWNEMRQKLGLEPLK